MTNNRHDFAYKSYNDIGAVVLDLVNSKEVVCKKTAFKSSEKPNPTKVAHDLADLANRNNCKIIMVDGPQVWKHPDNGHDYQRRL